MADYFLRLLDPTALQTKTNVIYSDPHKLQVTDHICYLNLGLNLITLYSRYFKIVTPFSKLPRRFERTRYKNRFNNSVMGAFNSKFEVITLFPN